MRRFFGFIVLLAILLEIFSPVAALAFISTVPVPSGGFVFKPCADLTSCAIVIGVQVFLTLFKSKIACLFGAESSLGDLIKGNIPKNLAPKELAKVDDLLGRVNTKENFGGQILQVMKCKCKGGDIVEDSLGKNNVYVIGNPAPAVVGPTTGSKIYNYKSLTEGNWVLGQKTDTKVCTNPIAYGIKQIGTSR